MGTHLVEKQLVACVNTLSPCASIFPAILRINRAKMTDLEAVFRNLHPPEVPGFLASSPDSGSEAFPEWLGRSLLPTPTRRRTPIFSATTC
ncbi:MAG: divalent cation tolerance protein CutA [Verrucomicrobiaceae bacterium]|nr:divalent cation tolerance protein CutA [Verrucomicrobiaceae bacterium]